MESAWRGHVFYANALAMPLLCVTSELAVGVAHEPEIKDN
jgi:hypothetical protein